MVNFLNNYGLNRLLMNISSNFRYVRDDYVGISLNPRGTIDVLTNLLISIVIISIFYLIGKKVRLLFFKKVESLNTLSFFINIALGYILVNTGIAILGTFSLFYAKILTFYIIFVCGIAVYPIRDLKNSIKDIFRVIKGSCLFFSKHKWISIGISLFILISFLRLIPPEVGEDSVGYHTDLPFLYLNSHTMIMEARDILHVIPVPQLGEMSYVVTEFLGHRDASRYVHFMFYLLVIAFLCYISKKNVRLFGLYPPILFITASVIIRISSKANVDFQALFCWLMAFYLIIKEKKLTVYMVALSGIFFGGALSGKLWEMVFFPPFITYIVVVMKSKIRGIKLAAIFFIFALLISCIWYIRSYIITGDPVYPAFVRTESFAAHISSLTFFNSRIFSFPNLVVFSPLFFLGILFSLSRASTMFKKLRKSLLFYFFVILGIEHIFIDYYLPRYLLNLYVVFILITSVGIYEFCSRVKLGKQIIAVIFISLFFYYFVNTMFILPYGFGWADQNKYLTRILSQDSSSYYDFNHKFSKMISSKDLVATYSMSGFYYANFNHIDIAYILNEQNNSLKSLKDRGATKLLILGVDIDWLCNK